MRTLLLLAALSLVACTVQSTGARCEITADCNTAQGDECRSEQNPALACSGSNTDRCICCPSNPTAAAAEPACRVTTTTADAGVRD